MAKLHNYAGQSHKATYLRFYNRSFNLMAWSFFALGTVFGLFLATIRYTLAAILILVTGLIIVWLIKRCVPRWEAISRERVRYLRGGQAEGLVAWLLLDLPDGWHLFNNLMIRPDQDLDHVTVGPGGVFAISSKSCRGLLSVGRGGLLHLNDEPTDFGEDTVRQAMRLRDLLAEKLGGPPIPYVNAVLAVPLAYTRVVNPVRNVTVLHQGDLTDAIERMPARLSAAAVKRIVAALETFPVAGEAPPNVAATPTPGTA